MFFWDLWAIVFTNVALPQEFDTQYLGTIYGCCLGIIVQVPLLLRVVAGWHYHINLQIFLSVLRNALATSGLN